MSEEIIYCLNNVLDSLIIIEKRFSKIENYEDFVIDEEGLKILDSIAMRLQFIGENLKNIYKINKEIFDKYPEIEWNSIMKLRDVISHHYDILDHEIIFDICENKITHLKIVIIKLLKEN